MRYYLIVFAKTTLSFLSLWGMTRLLGKRQISQITYFDYITGITIGSLAANLVTPANDWRALLSALVLWGALTYLFHWLSLKSRKLRDILDGTPTILIRHGRLMDRNLAKHQLNIQEVMSMLRARGHFNPAEVEFALLETNGELSVLPRSQFRPVQPRDLGVSTGYEGLPMQVMQEREPLRQALAKLGLSEDWLADELSRQGVSDPDDVFAAWLGTDGKLAVSPYGGEQVH